MTDDVVVTKLRPLIPVEPLLWLVLLQDPDRTWTVAELAEATCIGAGVLVGHVAMWREWDMIQPITLADDVCPTTLGIESGRNRIRAIDCAKLREMAELVGLSVPVALGSA